MRMLWALVAAFVLAAPAAAVAQSAPNQAMGYRGSCNTYTYGSYPIGRSSHAHDGRSGNNGAAYSGGGGTENGGTTAGSVSAGGNGNNGSRH